MGGGIAVIVDMSTAVVIIIIVMAITAAIVIIIIITTTTIAINLIIKIRADSEWRKELKTNLESNKQNRF